jgi:hypothetical protein
MYSKIVIFYTANYCQKIKSFFDVDDLLAKGNLVEFWDLSDLTAHEHLQPVESKGLKMEKFRSLKELKNAVRSNIGERVLYMSFVGFASYSFWVYRILSKYNADILFATFGTHPSINIQSKPTILDRLKRLKDFSKLKINIQIRIVYLLLKTRLFVPAKYVLWSCDEAVCRYKVSSSTSFIACNSGDYNNKMFHSQREMGAEKKQIVFIDQYMPFHNDFKLNGESGVNPEKYYKSLNNFFDFLEKKYEASVVICAHPSAEKYKDFNFFNGREIVYNKTSEYVQTAFGVVSHYSTALSYSVMAGKPIILITSDEFNKKYIEGPKIIELYHAILNAPIVNIDHIGEPCFKDIDKKAYGQFMYSYLTTELSHNHPNSEIIQSIVEGDYKRFIVK